MVLQVIPEFFSLIKQNKISNTTIGIAFQFLLIFHCSRDFVVLPTFPYRQREAVGKSILRDGMFVQSVLPRPHRSSTLEPLRSSLLFGVFLVKMYREVPLTLRSTRRLIFCAKSILLRGFSIAQNKKVVVKGNTILSNFWGSLGIILATLLIK